ncbi:SLOG family protein [Streptococcaceae bacterium ESL0729]|nr:SLOG family protein [Streptococcaceae bacterium ESL0729]
MKSILVCGYKDFELGIFKDNDQKVSLIKAVIRKKLLNLIDQGVEWFIFGGNKGFEFWVLEIVNELKEEYDLKTASIFAFENHGESWNEAAKSKLALFKGADYISYAYNHYENPGQFKEYNKFLLSHTDGIFCFYDSENPNNLKYLFALIEEADDYYQLSLSFDDLNEAYDEILGNDY